MWPLKLFRTQPFPCLKVLQMDTGPLRAGLEIWKLTQVWRWLIRAGSSLNPSVATWDALSISGSGGLGTPLDAPASGSGSRKHNSSQTSLPTMLQTSRSQSMEITWKRHGNFNQNGLWHSRHSLCQTIIKGKRPAKLTSQSYSDHLRALKKVLLLHW